jgi:hypothetical protein
MAQKRLVGQDLLSIQALRSHSDTPHSVRLLWISPTQRPLPDNTQHSKQPRIHAPRAGFEPTIPASERRRTKTLDCAVTGIGFYNLQKLKLGACDPGDHAV